MEFKKTFKLELSDYTAYNIFSLKKMITTLPLISICLTYLVFFREDYEFNILKFVIYAAGITAFSILGYYALIKHSAKKSFLSSKAMQAPHEITLNDTGVFSSGEFGNTNMSWHDIYRVVESKETFYVYLMKVQAVAIPKRLTSADENAIIRSIVKQSLPPDKYRLKEF